MSSRFNYEPTEAGEVIKSSPRGFRKVMSISEARAHLFEIERIPGIHSDVADLRAAIQLASES